MRPAVPPQEKRARSAVLAKLVRAFDPPHAALVGTTQRVLVSDVAPRGDGQVYVGHTKAYVQVLLDAAPGLLGAVAEVYVTSSSRWHVDATVVRVLKKGPEDAYTPVVTAYAEGRDPLITGKGTPAGGLGKGQGQGEGEGDGEEGLMTVRVRGSVKDTRVIPVVSRESQRQSRRGDDDDARGRSTGRSTSTSETTGRDHGNDQTRTTVMGSWLERGWARAVCEMVSGKGGGGMEREGVWAVVVLMVGLVGMVVAVWWERERAAAKAAAVARARMEAERAAHAAAWGGLGRYVDQIWARIGRGGGKSVGGGR